MNDAAICAGDAATTFTATSATAIYYLWSNNGSGTSNTTSGTIAGSYTVAATDANGCANTATGTLSVNSLPTVSVADAAICFGDSPTNFIANSPTAVSYLWSGNGIGTSSTASGSTAGNYTVTVTVTVTDANNCSNSATGTLTINATPSVSVNNATICTGEAVTTFTATAPTATSYTWSGNGTGTASTTFGNTAGNYTVSIADVQGCTNSATGTLTVNPLPTVSVNDAAICNGDPAAIFTATAPTATSYIWSGNGSGTLSTTPGTTNGTYTVTVTDVNNCSNSANGTLTVNSITVNLGADKTICAGSATTLDAGVAGASYVWNNGATTQSTTVSSSGSYDVIVTDLNGCTGKDTVAVNTGAALSVALGVDINACTGDVTTLDAGNSGATYLWNTTATSQSISISTTGNYDVVVTDGNGCIGKDTIVVTINTLPIVSVNNATICDGDQAANFTASSSTATSYLWSNNGSGSTASTSGTIAGNYTVMVNDANGCSESATGVLTVNTPPSVSVQSKTACTENLPVTISSTAPTATSYLWSGNGNGTVGTTNANTGGTYTLTVIDANGCSNTGNGVLTVNSTIVTLGADKSICAGSSVLLDAGNLGGTYSWNTGATTQNITVNTGGQYNVTVIGTNGCIGKDTVLVNIGTALSVNLGADQFLCSGSSVTLDAGNPGNSYSWSTGATSQSISVNNANSYHVTVTDGNGCIGRDTVVINASIGLTVNLGSDQTVCSGSNVTFDAGNSGATYLWNTSATTQTITANNTGSYDVIVSDANGCVGRDTVILTVNSLPTLTVDPAFVTNYDVNSGNVSLSFGQPSGGTYAGNGVSGNNFNTSTAGVGSHNITYTYTDGNGCINSTVLALNVSITTGIVTTNAKHNITVYPNPFSHHINISIPSDQNEFSSQYFILDNKGSLVLEGIIYSIDGESFTSINTEILNRGFYYLIIQNQEKTLSLKIVKSN